MFVEDKSSSAEHSPPATQAPVAVIGMSCLFPKSNDLKQYWRLLYHGIDAITDVPASHWLAEDYFDPDPSRPDHVYCKRGGFLSPVDFDPSEFGIPPASLEATDTSQLLGLLAARKALIDAGYGPDGKPFARQRTSVILGVTGTQELVIPLGARLGHPHWRRALSDSGVSPEIGEEVIGRIQDAYVSWQESSFPGLLGNVVAGRICNRLDLRGTNCVVDAACASSLGAVHMAVMELTGGRSDMVLTGGVDTLNDIFMHMCFSKTRVLSSSGDVRPFSKDADGTLLGEGVGILVLKRLADARRDGDRIYALIRGTGSSSDGKSQSIYSPRAEGQRQALETAYSAASIDTATVELIEAHGTGTEVGDRTEFKALKQVFNGTRPPVKRPGYDCAIGSVKSNIGHTKAAAGTAGVIKTALALYHKVLPPTLKATPPDPGLNIEQSPFYLNTEPRPWLAAQDHPRRCGVSAFGFGGSNFHMVLEEYQPSKEAISWDGSVEILTFGADSTQRLEKMLVECKKALQGEPTGEIIAKTAAQSRRSFDPRSPLRLAIVLDLTQKAPKSPADQMTAAVEAFDQNRDRSVWNTRAVFFGSGQVPGKLAFLFPGQGSQYVDMARDLVCHFPRALAAMEKADRHFGGSRGLSGSVYPQPAADKQDKKRQEGRLRQTDLAQPAIGAVSLGMTGVLSDFGLTPEAVCGHSYGELSALHSGGCIDEDAFIKLSILRGQLMAQAGGEADRDSGTMLAVKAELAKLDALVEEAGADFILANRNSPTQGVLSGSTPSIDQAEKLCRERKFKTVRLPVAAAFHSKLVASAQPPFKSALEEVRFQPGAVPVFSNTSGQPYPEDPREAKNLLASQILNPVDFVGNIENMYDLGVRTFVEVGPRAVLTGLAKAILKDRDIHALGVDSSSGKRFGVLDLACTLARLSALGYDVDLNGWQDSGPSPGDNDRKPRMSIPVGGANLKSKSNGTRTANSEKQKAAVEQQKPTRGPQPAAPPIGAAISENTGDRPQDPVSGADREMRPAGSALKPAVDARQPSPYGVMEALAVVQQGLKSMQALGQQTAEAHQKFLQTQTEASRTLQQMMAHTQRWAETVLGISGSDAMADGFAAGTTGPLFAPGSDELSPKPRMAAAEKARSAQPPPTGNTLPEADRAFEPGPPPAPNFPAPTPPDTGTGESAAYAAPEIQDTLLTVVSELTGYPVDMLDMDMDIESDLGIDSIKRVEILSAFEEKMPDLPSVPPDVMGTMKTLKQIVEYLSFGNKNQPPLSTAPVGAASFRADPGDADSPVEGNPVQKALIEVVSELTGYPVEMLEPDMDLEADLGIDSIKRVEILSAFEEKMPDLPSISPENMGTLKTLAQISSYLDGAKSDRAPSAGVTGPPAGPTPPVGLAQAIDQPLVTESVAAAPMAYPHSTPMLLQPGSRVVIAGDGAGLSKALADELAGQGLAATIISLEDAFDQSGETPAAGLIIVADPSSADPYGNLRQSFLLARSLGPRLLEEVNGSGAFFSTISRLDGAFGLSGRPMANPLHGALAGLVKTADREWAGVRCRAFDIAPDWENWQAIAKRVIADILRSDPAAPLEIGLDPSLAPELRFGIELRTGPLSPGAIDLEAGDVVVVTGGARGITAAAVMALAREVRPTLVLVGRSPAPFSEPAWLGPLDDEAAARKQISIHEFGGDPVSLRKIDKAYRKYKANREIADHLQALKKTGAPVHYFSVDTRDAEAVGELVAKVRADLGPVRALIHGAGVLADRLIVNKSPEQFDHVLDTKVKGALNFLAAVGDDPLKYLVMFSSVVARMGNQGQADYAMANEGLNKIAQQEALLRTDCRVISVNWGPWDGGMVTAPLKREFARRRVGLIPLAAGARSLIDLMAAPRTGAVEMVIGNRLEGQGQAAVQIKSDTTEPRPAPDGSNGLSITFKREIDVHRYPILRSHVLDGTPVVPFALMTEWFGHGALHENPGLLLQGIDDMRLLNGIRLDKETKLIRLMASKPNKNGSTYQVDVEIRDGVHQGQEIVHTRAKAVLAEELPPPPVFDTAPYVNLAPYRRSIDEVYEQILFHGADLRGITQIKCLTPEAMVAEIQSAPHPDQWMAEPLRSRWIGDPLMLDCAFQMASLWCYESRGMVSLPSYSASYRQYSHRIPQTGITAILDIRKVTRHKMTGDFTFLAPDNRVVARIDGYEAVMEKSLIRAFKP